MTLLSATLLLLIVMDPLGNIPFFILALEKVKKERRLFVIIRELLIALLILLTFLLTGQYILKALHVSEPALTVAGGVILLLIAIRMIFPAKDKSMQEEIAGEPFIVPLAIPYVAGPSAMATVILINSSDPGQWQVWILAVVLAWLATSVLILCSTPLANLLGKKGLIAMERLMGMVLIVVSIQMMMNGIALYFGIETVQH